MTGSNKNHAALIRRAKEDPKAFGEIYEHYVQRIYNYVYYRTGNVHDAEDLTSRVFMRAMNHLPYYKDRGLPFSAWLYRIAHNLVANWHRDSQRRKNLVLDDQMEGDVNLDMQAEGPENTAENREQTQLLLRAIRRLPSDRQQLLILKFVDRISNAEIGMVIGRSEGAVKSLYHRTLLTLRKNLEKNG